MSYARQIACLALALVFWMAAAPWLARGFQEQEQQPVGRDNNDTRHKEPGLGPRDSTREWRKTSASSTTKKSKKRSHHKAAAKKTRKSASTASDATTPK